MTRVESILTQILELTSTEQKELGEMLDEHFEATPGHCPFYYGLVDEYCASLSAAQMSELYRRIAEIEAGESVLHDKETFLRLIDETLAERKS